MVTILARSRWTSTAARGTPFTWSRIRGIVCHYPAMGASVGVLSEAGETARLRGWRNYHVGRLGWADIGYNYAIGQSGRVYSLRGDRVGGHAVGHNSRTVGVLFIVGDNEPLTAAARASFRALRATLRRRGAGAGVWGHTEMSGNSTRCPGPYIMADIRSGVLKGASAGTSPAGSASAGSASAPSPARPWASSARIKGLSVADVKAIQTELVGAGYDLGKYGIDGSYGDSTGLAVKALQHDLGITSDGVYGPGTEKEIMAIQDDIKALDKKTQAFGEQNQWRIDRALARIEALDKKVQAFGDQVYWRVDAKLPAQINAAQAALVAAIQESGKAQGLTEEQVEHIATRAGEAAAEAAARVSAEDVAAQLEVSTKSTS